MEHSYGSDDDRDAGNVLENGTALLRARTLPVMGASTVI
jgi:hypothetical protein